MDWEWYHDNLEGVRTDGVNSLSPDPVRYPHGMKYVAEEIEKMGLIPALWIGYTNEPESNEFIEKHPDALLVKRPEWCGQYFYDFSHPDYLNKYLPTAIENVHKWGYKAVKYDTLPTAIILHDRFHGNMYNPNLTTKEAFRNMIKKVRELLGKDMYALSCSGGGNASVLWGSDYFDAARIGEDIFSWDEYIRGCIEKLQIYYPLHNIQFLNDPDNVILREEFNTFEQAKSRISLVSLLGLPMTFGDEFDVLDASRVELIKRNLPVLDIHPLDLTSPDLKKDNLIINLNVELDQTNYLVSGLFNMTDKDDSRTYNLSKDFNLPKGEYLAYDFYRDEFLGTFNKEISLDFLPFECRVLSVRQNTKLPQIVNTSRHIMAGAAEIKKIKQTKNQIDFTADLVKNDTYTISVYIPNEYIIKSFDGFEKCEINGNIAKLSLLPTKTANYTFKIKFAKN